MTLKIRGQYKYIRKLGNPPHVFENFDRFTCNFCRTGDHQACEDHHMLFCACWRELHEEVFT